MWVESLLCAHPGEHRVMGTSCVESHVSMLGMQTGAVVMED